MKPLALLGVPAVAGAGLAVVFSVVGPDVPQWMLQLADAAVFTAALTASLAAARAFSPGDYLRRAWILMSACYLLLVLDTLLFGVATSLHPRNIGETGALVSGFITLLANVATVVGLVLVARAWRVAGLTLQVSTRTFALVQLTLAAVTLWLLGPTALRQLGDALNGKTDQLHELASTLGDVVSILVVGPLLMTALSLRGGSLAWPWGLIALSTVLWLGVDGADALGGRLAIPAATVAVLTETLRALASLYQASAALAQRRALAT